MMSQKGLNLVRTWSVLMYWYSLVTERDFNIISSEDLSCELHLRALRCKLENRLREWSCVTYDFPVEPVLMGCWLRSCEKDLWTL